MKFLIVCGGSAGHINPAIAIAEEIRSKMPESKILFVGADKTLEKKLVPAAGFDIVNIKMSGVRRGFSPEDVIHNVKTVKNVLTAKLKSKKLLKEQNPDAVIGTGGYICYPILKKSTDLSIPTFILEPNAYPGLAVRMLSAVVDRIFVTYKELENQYSRPDRVIYTGTPLRSEFYENTDISVDNKERPLVVSYWGSLGAVKMNEIIQDFIKLNLKEKKFDHIHATGAGSSAEDMIKKLQNCGIEEVKAPIADIREYIDNMSVTMKAADIVISRSGASTIAELTALSKPAILIPSPNVTDNHQEVNAKQLQAAGGAIMILEKDCTGENLFSTVSQLLADGEELEKMSNAQKSLSAPGAAAKIVESVIDFCANKSKEGEVSNGRQ